MFIQTGLTVFQAILQLFFIALIGGVLIRRQIISGLQVSALSNITVSVFLPSMILAKILTRFHPETFDNWWLLPLSGAGMVFSGLLFSGLLFRMRPEKRPLMTLASMQNGLYITLPVGQVLFRDQFDHFALYSFLLVMGLNPVMWSLGKVMISGKSAGGICLQDFITPPLVAIFLSVFTVLTGLAPLVPKLMIASIDLLGQATVPSAVFILGATMGTISLRQMPGRWDVFVVAAVKFGIIPAGVFIILYTSGVYKSMPLFCSMLIIQAAAPPATNLILMVKTYGGDAQTVSSLMLILYGLSIVALPVWIAAWQVVAG